MGMDKVARLFSAMAQPGLNYGAEVYPILFMKLRIPVAGVFEKMDTVARAKRCCCAYFIAECRGACGVEGRVSGVRRHGRASYVGTGLSARARVRMMSASGQAEAKATRIREVVSITRAATLRRRTRTVANSAVARAAVFGISC